MRKDIHPDSMTQITEWDPHLRMPDAVERPWESSQPPSFFILKRSRLYLVPSVHESMSTASSVLRPPSAVRRPSAVRSPQSPVPSPALAALIRGALAPLAEDRRRSAREGALAPLAPGRSTGAGLRTQNRGD